MPARDCAFCSIVAGRARASIVLEDERSLAFLDTRPLFPGHVLLVPREHFATLTELPAPLLMPLFSNAQRLCRAVESATGSEGTFVAVNNRVSQSVPHLHVHIVPRNRKDGLRGFFWPRRPYDSPEEMERVAAAIRAALQTRAVT